MSVRILYDIGISLYFLGARVLGLFNDKAAQFVSGRKGLFRTIGEEMSGMRRQTDGMVPLFFSRRVRTAMTPDRELRNMSPDRFIVITFFSALRL